MSSLPKPPAGKKWICRPYITVRGRRIYAYQHGKKAFCFLVDV